MSAIGGLLSLLNESDMALKVYALQQLDSMTALFWMEIADSLTKM